MALYEIGGHEPQLPAGGSVWIAPGAHVIGDARLARGVSVWFGAVIRADNTAIVVGERTNIQEGAMLHSDADAPLVIGAGCTIGHHAILHGCTIGDDVLVGMGATVLNRALIPPGCLIGAGALVTEGKSFSARSLIVGSPARTVRELDDAALAAIRASAHEYAKRAAIYAGGLRVVSETGG